jgi:hypothetical protein
MPYVTGEVEAEELKDQPHHEGWNEALRRALEEAGDFGGTTVKVEFSAKLTPNPGQIQRYIATLS